MLRFIVAYQAAHGGVSPTFRECGHALGWKAKTRTRAVLDSMEERGAISRLRSRQRAIKVLAPVAIPMIDQVPLYAVPVIDGPELRFSGERL